MELFTIERYVGDSPPMVDIHTTESQRLAELLKQAKGRKRLQEISEQPDKSDTHQSQGKTPTERKKRKKKKDMAKNAVNLDTVKEGKISLQYIDHEEQDSGKCIEPVDDVECAWTENSAVISISNSLTGQEARTKDTQATKKEKHYEEITVIGGQAKKQTPKSVRRILPKWLANPHFFSHNVQHNLLPVDGLEQLDEELVKKLEKHHIQHFFPVQQVIIPVVLSCWEERSPFGKGGFFPPDLCVCAPTGSGKTLAYVLPVVQLLQSCVIRRLEALVIVPTKDLATQVWRIFNVYSQGTNLKVGLANGLKSLQREQEQLGIKSRVGYSSHVNILVATPGRLVEHISSSVGFTLQFLRFFVIDEADRLLAESYFGWLNKVYDSVYSLSTTNREDCRTVFPCARFPPQLLTPFWSMKIQRPLQKLLFSATLTQNPEKLSPLQLYQPKFFTVSKSTANGNEGMRETELCVEDGFLSVSQTPATLEESMYICNSGGKPLVLLYLLKELKIDRVLCFASSIESTHRLYLLVKHFGGVAVTEFSSTLSAGQRKSILENFNDGKTQLIICSDAMARGLDLQGVQYVVSYDPPVSSKTYIHRVGRTARAGKTGNAITLLHDNEVFHFKKLLKSLDKSKICKHSVKDSALEPLMARYEEALEQLKTEVNTDKKQLTVNKYRRVSK